VSNGEGPVKKMSAMRRWFSRLLVKECLLLSVLRWSRLCDLADKGCLCRSRDSVMVGGLRLQCDRHSSTKKVRNCSG